MDSNQQILLTLLSAAINGENNVKIDNTNISLKDIYEEAKAHQVHALLYPLIKNMYADNYDNKEIISEWRKMSILIGMTQIEHINQMQKVFHQFNELDIPIIALKGLALRGLYPHPEFRSMSDADILIHKEDLDRSKQLLIQLGYYENSSNSIHITFHHKNHLPVELHWAPIDYGNIKVARDFENTIWETTIPVTICNEPVLSLSPESQLLYLCLHLASHFVHSGFGLRQLCDIVLVINSVKPSIDWSSFYENCKLNGIDTFVIAIFTVCKKLFNIEVPSILYFRACKDIHFINMLINDIFSSGVYGNKNIARVASSSILRAQDNKYCEYSKSKFLLALAFLFPLPKKLFARYSYAKKYPILTPIAWVHRIIYNMFHKDFNMFKKTISFSDSLSITQNRYEVINWLKLY